MHMYGSVNWLLVCMTLVWIAFASMALITSVRYLYGKPVWMKTLYNDQMGRPGYALIAAFVVIAGFVLLYLQFR